MVHSKFYSALFFLMFISFIGKANNDSLFTFWNIKESNKGKMYIYWGYNRAAYSTSDIKFKGRDFDFELTDVKAKDRQTKFNWNLYQGRKLKIQERNSREQIKAATYEKEALERNIESLVSANLAELKQSKLTLEAFTESYNANVQSREQLKAQFFSANISLLELLQSERDFLEAAEALVLNTKKVRMAEHLHLFYTGILDSYLMIAQENY